MENTESPLEDWRGVDLGQIRAQLRMSVENRVREMVHAANVMITLHDHARRTREGKAS